MISRTTIGALIASLAILLLAIACSGDDDTTPTATTAISPSASPDVPNPPTPVVDEGSPIVAEGTFSSTVIPGGTANFDPLTLPLNPGAQLPPCDTLVFSFGWIVIDPLNAENIDLRWQSLAGAIPEDIGSGPSGVASAGCGNVQAVNGGGAKLTFEAHYKITSATP